MDYFYQTISRAIAIVSKITVITSITTTTAAITSTTTTGLTKTTAITSIQQHYQQLAIMSSTTPISTTRMSTKSRSAFVNYRICS